METKQFQAGKTYTTRSICDHDCIIEVTIARRTAKTVTTTEGKTFRPSIYNGVEQIKPWGSYSMSPAIGADDCLADRILCAACGKYRVEKAGENCAGCTYEARPAVKARPFLYLVPSLEA